MEATEWLRGWYSRFKRYRGIVRAKTIDSPQALLAVNATKLVSYLLVRITNTNNSSVQDSLVFDVEV